MTTTTSYVSNGGPADPEGAEMVRRQAATVRPDGQIGPGGRLQPGAAERRRHLLGIAEHAQRSFVRQIDKMIEEFPGEADQLRRLRRRASALRKEVQP